MSIEQWMESEGERREAERLKLDTMRLAREQRERFELARDRACCDTLPELQRADPNPCREWAKRFVALANLIDTPHPDHDHRTWSEVREEFLNGDMFHQVVVRIIDLAIAGETAAIAKCLANLVGPFDEVHYSGRFEFRQALYQLDAELGAWKRSGQPQVNAASSPARGYIERTKLFVGLRNEGLGNAAIRDHWNGLPDAERKRICPKNPDRLPKGKHGTDRVRKSIEAHDEKLTKSQIP